MARCLAVVFRARLSPGLSGPDKDLAPFVWDVSKTIVAARVLDDADERKKSALLLAKTVIKWTTIAFYEGFDATLVWHLPTLLPAIMVAPELSAEDDELTAMARQVCRNPRFLSFHWCSHDLDVQLTVPFAGSWICVTN